MRPADKKFRLHGKTATRRAKPCARASRRESIYQREHLRYGFVPCWVCGKHVTKAKATLEHILPKSLGGSDAGSNLAISHGTCNSTRGNKLLAHRAQP